MIANNFFVATIVQRVACQCQAKPMEISVAHCTTPVFFLKHILAYTKRYNTCSTRFVHCPCGFLANTFIPIVPCVYLTYLWPLICFFSLLKRKAATKWPFKVWGVPLVWGVEGDSALPLKLIKTPKIWDKDPIRTHILWNKDPMRTPSSQNKDPKRRCMKIYM